jgi:hypothetical protein
MVDHKDPIAELSDLMISSFDGLHKLDELTSLIAGAAVKGHAFTGGAKHLCQIHELLECTVSRPLTSCTIPSRSGAFVFKEI